MSETHYVLELTPYEDYYRKVTLYFRSKKDAEMVERFLDEMMETTCDCMTPGACNCELRRDEMLKNYSDDMFDTLWNRYGNYIKYETLLRGENIDKDYEPPLIVEKEDDTPCEKCDFMSSTKYCGGCGYEKF